ncbi:MAG: DUF547 domain-containing protein [Bryobacteraceae bacterium]
MTFLLLLFSFTGLLCATQPSPPDTRAFDAVLKEYALEDGTVRYAELRDNIAPLSAFVERIAAVSPHSHPKLFPTREHALAYWLNTYNALVLWSFAKDYPKGKDRLRGLVGRGLFFFRTKFPVGGVRRSLDDIEHKTIRDEFKDPRIHFAIVCASSSCPKLPRDVFTAENVNGNLDRAAREFLNDGRNVKVTGNKREISVSKIFDWFQDDFGPDKQAVVRYIAKYRPQDAAALREGIWKVRYFSYDWGLNDASRRSQR